MLLERRQITLENLPPPALVGQYRLDAPQLLRDRVVLLLQPLQAPVELVEVAENLPEALVDLVKAPIHFKEALLHVPVQGRESTVSTVSPGRRSPAWVIETPRARHPPVTPAGYTSRRNAPRHGATALNLRRKDASHDP